MSLVRQFTVRRIDASEGPLLRQTRLAALADAPGEALTTLERARRHGDDHWDTAAAANASGGQQATFFAFADADDADPGGDNGGGDSSAAVAVGMIGAYANRDGTVNVVGLWSAPGHRDVGVAEALLDAVGAWARGSGAGRLRLWVVERNEHTQRFYRDVGFGGTGVTMPYEPEPRLAQVEMVRPL